MTTTKTKAIWIDYSRGAFDKHGTVPVTFSEREGLRVNDIVEILGDDVAPRRARVEAINDDVPQVYTTALVTLAFLD